MVDQRLFEQLLERARRRREKRLKYVVRLYGRQRANSAESIAVHSIRAATGLSQAKFAELLGIQVSTLRNWEQGRREPTGPARALLRAIRNDPVGVIDALSR
jgi:putative transcriptional regulator